MKLLTILVLFLLLTCCKNLQTIGEYGILDTKRVCTKNNLAGEKLTLQIDRYQFIFDYEQFEKTMSQIESGTYMEELNKLKEIFSTESKNLIQIGDGYIVNQNDTIYNINSGGINLTLDAFCEAGMFYLKSPDGTECIVHKNWQPHYQGNIFSEWIIDGKTVKRIYFGSVD